VNQKSDQCQETEVVGFLKLKRNAVCSKEPMGTVQPGATGCPPGSSRALHGKCHTSEWDFGDED
jgi:hypothetical protein